MILSCCSDFPSNKLCRIHMPVCTFICIVYAMVTSTSSSTKVSASDMHTNMYQYTACLHLLRTSWGHSWQSHTSWLDLTHHCNSACSEHYATCYNLGRPQMNQIQSSQALVELRSTLVLVYIFGDWNVYFWKNDRKA